VDLKETKGWSWDEIESALGRTRATLQVHYSTKLRYESKYRRGNKDKQGEADAMGETQDFLVRGDGSNWSRRWLRLIL